MTKQFYKDAVGWGIGLWLIGYILGIVLFAVVPPRMIGWVIMPIVTVITLWALSAIRDSRFVLIKANS